MTIHYIINDYNLSLGGAQRLAIDLHKGALQAGLSSKLLGLSNDPNYNIEESKSFKNKSVYNLFIPFKIWYYFKKEVISGDVVHVHLFPAIFYVSVLHIFKLLPKCKLILTEHNTSNRRRNKFWGRIIDYLTYKSYDKIIAISEGTADFFFKWKPSLEHKLQIINNGAHLTFDNCIVRKQKPTPIIISVGRLHVQKNYKTAISAISKIKELNFEY